MNTQGGTKGFTIGNLKRRLATVVIADLDNTLDGENTDERTTRLLLRGLSGVLNVQIAVMVQRSDQSPLRAGDYPSTPGTYQLIPIVNFSDGNKGWLRPLFQDPTLAANENHPLPQDIPYSWEFATSTDEVEIEVEVDRTSWDSTEIGGRLVCQVTVEYNGAWWDVEAIELALGQVQLVPGSAYRIGTHNAG